MTLRCRPELFSYSSPVHKDLVDCLTPLRCDVRCTGLVCCATPAMRCPACASHVQLMHLVQHDSTWAVFAAPLGGVQFIHIHCMPAHALVLSSPTSALLPSYALLPTLSY
eukprot:3686047-Rhodomonas_salina.1